MYVKHVKHIKWSCAWFDLELMFKLTQILTTSKACQQTGVNLVVKLVTFTMDMDTDQQAAVLRKKLDNNPDLSKSKWKKLEDRGGWYQEAITCIWDTTNTTGHDQIGPYNTQVRWVWWGGPKGLSLPGAMYWESCSMNHLTWPTDCKTYSGLAKAKGCGS